MPNTLDEVLHISADPWSRQKGEIWSCGQEITIIMFNVAILAAEETNLCLKMEYWVQKTWTVPMQSPVHHGSKKLIN